MKKTLLAMGLIVAAGCSAQSTPDDGIKLGDVNFTATLRSRLYSWDWFQAGVYQNEYAYSGNLPRLNFAETRGALDLDVEIAVPFMLGLPRNAVAPAPQGALGLGANDYSANANHRFTALAFPKQLYGRYHLDPGNHQTIQAGRFEFNDGTELTPKNATLAALKRDHI